MQELIDKIVEINKEVGAGKNNFDFLTLREDFSIHSDRYSYDDKIKLSEILKSVDKQTKTEKYLKDLYIDYGFALDGLKKGYTKNSLADSFVSEKNFCK